MNFGQALEALKSGNRVRRAGWNGKGMWLRLVVPSDDRHELLDDGRGGGCVEMTRDPYIEMKTAQDTLVPWLASQSDILADDWDVLVRDRETVAQMTVLVSAGSEVFRIRAAWEIGVLPAPQWTERQADRAIGGISKEGDWCLLTEDGAVVTCARSLFALLSVRDDSPSVTLCREVLTNSEESEVGVICENFTTNTGNSDGVLICRDVTRNSGRSEEQIISHDVITNSDRIEVKLISEKIRTNSADSKCSLKCEKVSTNAEGFYDAAICREVSRADD